MLDINFMVMLRLVAALMVLSTTDIPRQHRRRGIYITN